MGQKDFTPKLFHSLSLAKLVPKGHLVRRLEQVLDLGCVRRLCRSYYSHTGQPSVDPVVVFKMLLLGYFYGITSEHRLAEDCSLNLAFRWYLGYDLDEATPNYSVLSKARQRYGPEVFEKFFEQVLQQCLEADLVGGDQLFVDSTLMEANASVQSLVAREPVAGPGPSPKEYVQSVFRENPVEEGSVPTPVGSSDSPPGSVEKEIRDRKEQWRKKKSTAEGQPRRPKKRNQEQVSTTDPDASVVKRPSMKTKLAYKGHFAVDGHRRVITAVEATPRRGRGFLPRGATLRSATHPAPVFLCRLELWGACDL